MKKSLWSLFLIVLLLLFGHLYYLKTGGFRTTYLLKSESLPAASLFQANLNESELRNILNQKFTYLGKGLQTYAFLSEDGQFVLKLLKNDYLRSTPWTSILPPIYPFRQFLLCNSTEREKKKNKLLKGYETAFCFDHKNTGLLHFHRYNQEKPLEVTLVTGLGNRVFLDLNRFVFALQLKATVTRKELSSLLSKGKVQEAKERLFQLIDLYFEEYSRGIFDYDKNFLVNTSFYQTRAIRHDVGRIVRDKSLVTPELVEKDLAKILEQRLDPWLKKNYPQYAEELMEELRRKVASGLENYGLAGLFIQRNDFLFHFQCFFDDRA